MARLTEGAESLISALGKAQAELEWVGQQLEAEFARKHRGGKEPNPLDLLQRINKLRRRGTATLALREECRQVLAARQTVVDAAKQQLVGNTALLAQLLRRAGLASDAESEETQAAFAAAIREHEAGVSVQLQQQAAQIDREQLNAAFVQSTLV
eukprot:scaffold14.g1176.t1